MNNAPNHFPVGPPKQSHRIYSVWWRHVRVYMRHIISNGFPAFFEPLLFLAGIGLGLGQYVGKMNGVDYVQYLAVGIILTPAMFTAAFECSYGTFIRLEYDKVYDGMLSGPLSATDLIIGEILFAATKAFFFSLAVVIVILIFGLLPSPLGALTPALGFLVGLMFAPLSMFVTSFVKTINHFNFFFTGILTPLFFFSDVTFPLAGLPKPLRLVAEFFPLCHPVRLARALCYVDFKPIHLFDAAYIIVFILLFGTLALYRLRKRLVD